MKRTLMTLAAILLLCGASSASAQQTTPAEPIFIPEPASPAGFSYIASALATTRFNPSDDFDHVENELE
jgi:predicted outer membrane protein